jgi:hypothetical protein
VSATSDWSSTETLNISSEGMFIRIPPAVQPRENLEVWIAWPVPLDKHIPLRLITKGRVVRNGEAGTAMRFNNYEFRTGYLLGEARGMRSDGHANGEANIKIAG